MKDEQAATQRGHDGCEELCEVKATESPWEFQVICPRHGSVRLISWAHARPAPRFTQPERSLFDEVAS